MSTDDYKAMEAGYVPSPTFLFDKLAAYCKRSPGELIYGPYFYRPEPSHRDSTGSPNTVESTSPIDDEIIFEMFNKFIHKHKTDQHKINTFIMTDDSMSPTLKTGDLAIVNLQSKLILTDGLYLVKAGNKSAVRRISRKIGGNFVCSCDNELYSSSTIDPVQMNEALLGKVVATMKSEIGQYYLPHKGSMCCRQQ